MKLSLSLCLLFICGFILTSCRVPNLNQTAIFTQASAQNIDIETEQEVQQEVWQYAKLSTFSHSGELQATWTTGDGVIPATGGVLVLAEKIMGILISDTDDAFIIFFDHLGKQGWELQQIRTVDKRTEYWFKRINHTD